MIADDLSNSITEATNKREILHGKRSGDSLKQPVPSKTQM